MIRELSVVMPAYNAGAWLPKSIPRIDKAMKKAGFTKGEIIVIDDGSTDDTKQVVTKIKTKYPLRLCSYENGGRFLARKRGTVQSKYDHILFIDTRIYIAEDGIKFIVDTQDKQPERQVWTSHVHLDKEGNIYARFWEAITYLAWHKYFKNPRDFSYGLKEFDAYPKGTTCFFTPKNAFQQANEWFEKNTKDMKTSNDDTLLIRRIAEHHNININPQFSCVYHARTNLKQFVKHVYHRGKVFVDGFLRKDGNKLFYALVAFLIGTATAPFLFVLFPQTLAIALCLFVFCWLLMSIIMLSIGVDRKDTMSFFILSPLFFFAYGLGIWRAFIKIYVEKVRYEE